MSYLDFVVDGERLQALISESIGFDPDLVSPLQAGWPVEAVEAIERLLGERPGDLPDGRASLYICPECSDLGCGAITAQIEITQTAARWHDLGFQDENHPEIKLIGDTSDDRSFTFDRAQYEVELQSQLSHFRKVAEGWTHPGVEARRKRRRTRRARLTRIFGLGQGDGG